MQPAIGFIGIGRMGAYMARNLIERGYSLFVYDLDEAAMERLVAAGAVQGTNPRDVAERSPVVITMLPASPNVEEVVLGPEGVLEGAGVGSILIDMSSSYPGSTRMIGESLAERGVSMLDAPVSGGVKGAREATLSIMVGGAEGDFEECHPIFAAMGQNIYHVGPLSAGHVVKALNNLCSACSMLITAEAMAVAVKMGISPEKVLEVINSSTGRSWSSQFKFPTYVLDGSFNSGFSIGLMNKDIEVATRLGWEWHVPMLVGATVQQYYNLAAGRDAAACHTAIVKLVEDWSGVAIRAEGT